MSSAEINTYDRLMKLRRIPDAFEKWTGYRNQLTDYIIKRSDAGTRITVIGAGECNDLDLQVLSSHFRQVCLVDKDMDSMKTGTARQLKNCDNIETVLADITGIDDAAYRKLCNEAELLIWNQGRSADLTDLILENINAAFEKRKTDIYEKIEISDYVVCSGVHSQLNNVFPQLAELYSSYAGVNLDKIYGVVKNKDEVFAAELNDLILNKAVRGTFTGFELCRKGMDGAVEGAYQGMRDMLDRGIAGTETAELLWPFDADQGKIYLMKIIACRMQHEN